MTIIQHRSGGFTLPPIFDGGLSDDARTIRRRASEATDFTPSIALGKQAVFKALITAFAEAQEEGWDGYSASPAGLAALLYALQFLKNLPTAVPTPEISIDSDGDIAIEWDRGPRRIFSVRVGRDGTLHYAGLVGHSTFHGTELLTEGIPRAISAGIDRVVRVPEF